MGDLITSDRMAAMLRPILAPRVGLRQFQVWHAVQLGEPVGMLDVFRVQASMGPALTVDVDGARCGVVGLWPETGGAELWTLVTDPLRRHPKVLVSIIWGVLYICQTLDLTFVQASITRSDERAARFARHFGFRKTIEAADGIDTWRKDLSDG